MNLKEFLGIDPRKNEDKWHWYQCKFSYRDQNNKEIFNFFTQIGLVRQADVLSDRIIKMANDPVHKMKPARHLLENGKLVVKKKSYLGYFGKLDKTNKEKFRSNGKSKRKPKASTGKRSVWQQLCAIMPGR